MGESVWVSRCDTDSVWVSRVMVDVSVWVSRGVMVDVSVWVSRCDGGPSVWVTHTVTWWMSPCHPHRCDGGCLGVGESV